MQLQSNRMANKKLRGIISAFILIIMICSTIIMASETDNTCLTPTDNQYFELRAVQVNQVEGQNKQVIMELWGNNIEFKGFDVRFSYDSTNIQPSNITTNEITSDGTKFFEFENEFKGNLDFFNIQYDKEGSGVLGTLSFNPLITERGHVIKKDDIGYVVNTDGGVLLGKMSFQMTADEFDVNWFKLETNDDSYPHTGIKININGTNNYQAQSTFRFTDQTASKDADLTKIILSTGEIDGDVPENSTYKEYQYTPTFDKDTQDYDLTLLEYVDNMNITVTKSHEKATMKIKVPKRDENNKLEYETDGITIKYEEKEILNNIPLEVTLNKLGEPDTKLTVIVTAENGTTTKEYAITIKRPYGTVKGKIYTEPTNFTTEKHIADVLAYSDADIVGQVNWEVAINNTKNYKSDNLNSVFRGDTENGINGIKEKNKIQTNDDGIFEMYLIPGKYTVLIDKKGYLDQYYININIMDKNQIDLSSYETSNVITLIPGDINKDGTVGILDKTIMTKQNGKKSTDLDFNSSADVNDDDVINITDKTILTKNNNSVRKIIDIGGIS